MKMRSMEELLGALRSQEIAIERMVAERRLSDLAIAKMLTNQLKWILGMREDMVPEL